MSSESDFERLLRDARGALPDPALDVTERAREEALAAARKRCSRRARLAAASIAGFVVALVAGIGIGALVTPSGHAAKGPVGLGFLPALGWMAFQTGGEASPVYQTIAIASNVPLDPEDQIAGAATASGLPYTTLQRLPANGVVIVASFTRIDPHTWPPGDLPKRELPLDLREATHYVPYGTQVRPEEPLGEWEIRAVVNGHYVDVVVYFGTQAPSASLRADVNRQLAGLVVERAGHAASEVVPRATGRQSSSPGAAVATNVVERTLSCTTGVQAGAHVVYVGVQSGLKKGNVFQNLAQASVTTAGTRVASNPNQVQPQLVAMTAGYPAKPPLTGGGLGYDKKRCTPVKANVPFTRRGLSGGIARQFGEQVQCFPPGKVLVHFRTVFASRPAVRTDPKSRFWSALGRIEVGQIAVRTTSGKALAFADVVDSGRARGFTAGSCS
jgi:hypothetical protein